MGKKRKAPAPDPATALLVARVEHEKRWAYALWIEHVPYPTMAARSILPPEDGGLGYYLPPATLKGLVGLFRGEQGDVIGSRDEQRERDAIKLDRLEALATETLAQAAKLGMLDIKAAGLILDVQTRRAKLLGSDAPLELKADVTTRDAVIEELNDMLIRAGRKGNLKPAKERHA